MRVQGLNIALRPRSSWEAVDLGVALVRRHAKPIFLSWILVTGMVFAGLHALLVPLDLAWLAGLLFWWLKPAFDRIPIYVLSHAIMGQTPTVRDALRAQRNANWRLLLPWLLWRRLHPMRSMLLAVDLLEGERGPRRAERVRVLGAGETSTPMLLWVIGAHIEVMLWGSIIAFGLMLVPTEFLTDSAKALFEALFEHPPWWMQLLNNGLYWLAMSVIEPFYVGAGFALYLNRRTQLEAWDIELAFRRIAARLGQAASVVLLLALVGFAPAGVAACAAPTRIAPVGAAAASGILPRAPLARPCAAQAATPAAPIDATPSDDEADSDDVDDRTQEDENEGDDSPITPLSQLLDEPPSESRAAFARAVKQALEDPDLSPKQQRGEWRWRDPYKTAEPDADMPPWVKAIGAFVALAIENILWILLALALLLALIHHRRWLPWLLARGARATPPTPSSIEDHALPTALPQDLTTAVLALWQAGEARPALSLFYRGALSGLVERVGSPLPPGATEAECLRIARRLPPPDAFSAVFRRVVACWQATAYAHRLPTEAELQDLLAAWRHAERPA